MTTLASAFLVALGASSATSLSSDLGSSASVCLLNVAAETASVATPPAKAPALTPTGFGVSSGSLESGAIWVVSVFSAFTGGRAGLADCTRIMFCSIKTSLAPPIRIRCSTLSRRTNTRRRLSSTTAASVTASRGRRFREPRILLLPAILRNSQNSNNSTTTRLMVMTTSFAPIDSPSKMELNQAIGHSYSTNSQI